MKSSWGSSVAFIVTAFTSIPDFPVNVGLLSMTEKNNFEVSLSFRITHIGGNFIRQKGQCF